MNAICLNNLSIRYGNRCILHNISHCFAAAQWHLILGRSGMGKSTLLHAIADLLPHNADISGSITTAAGDALQGKIAYMAQHNDLLPWLSLQENVLLGARLQGKAKDYPRATALLAACGLEEYAAAKPRQLSGGQTQRAPLARTLMQDRPYVLMDEPFSALDAITRYELQNLALQLLSGKTVIMISHDPTEALRLANSLHILTPAALQPVALPDSRTTPRALDTQGLAQLQEQLIQQLRHA